MNPNGRPKGSTNKKGTQDRTQYTTSFNVINNPCMKPIWDDGEGTAFPVKKAKVLSDAQSVGKGKLLCPPDADAIDCITAIILIH